MFYNGNIIFAENLTLAGNNVTTDISHGLQIPDEAAEVTKIKYGSVIAPFNEKFEINLDSNQKKILVKTFFMELFDLDMMKFLKL